MKQLVDNFQVSTCIELKLYSPRFSQVVPTKAISKINKQIESIDDMHRFIESFPEFRHQSGSVAKHVNLISEERSQQTYEHQTSVAHFVNF